MKNIMGLSAILVAAWVGLAAAAQAQPVGQKITVVLSSGKVVHGTLLGEDQGVYTLESSDGIAEDIPESQIRRAFDAAGHPLDLAAWAAASGAGTSSETEKSQGPTVYSKPAPPRHNGALVAGKILGISGEVVTGLGIVAVVGGAEEEGNATNVYYNGVGPTSSGYAYETIPGHLGYYTYTQYVNYYAGAAWVDTGIAVGVVGLSCLITGIILEAHGHKVATDALLHYQDGKLAWGVPTPSLDPTTQGYRTTLATARF